VSRLEIIYTGIWKKRIINNGLMELRRSTMVFQKGITSSGL
jgi:hypothetical protein